MLAKRVLAWIVFGVGLTTLIATSDDDSDDDGWSRTVGASASLHSEGAGDDKILRITIRRSDELAYGPLSADLSLTATASRAASDIRIDWLYPGTWDGGAGDALGDAGLSTTASMVKFSQGFTVLNIWRDLSLVHCKWGIECVTVQEAHVHADASDAYDLTLQVAARVEGNAGPTAPGMLTLAVEVFDAQ